MGLNRVLVRERLDLVRAMLAELEGLRELPREEFLKTRNAAAAESFLRRSLEAVFDVGRHILAKTGKADLAQEYKGIAKGLGAQGVVSEELAAQLAEMAGYRNRLVHLYSEVTSEELYRIVHNELGSIRVFIREMVRYIDELRDL